MSPPKIEFGVSAPSCVLFPETKSFTPAARTGKLDGGESPMTNVPDIAVVEVRDPPLTLPDTVPTSAIDSLSLALSISELPYAPCVVSSHFSCNTHVCTAKI